MYLYCRACMLVVVSSSNEKTNYDTTKKKSYGFHEIKWHVEAGRGSGRASQPTPWAHEILILTTLLCCMNNALKRDVPTGTKKFTTRDRSLYLVDLLWSDFHGANNITRLWVMLARLSKTGNHS